MGPRPVVVLEHAAARAANGIAFDYSQGAGLALHRFRADHRRQIADSNQEGPATTRGIAVAAAAAGAGIELIVRQSADSAPAAHEAVRNMLQEQGGGTEALCVFNDHKAG